MINKIENESSSRKKKVSFTPNRKFINNAVEEYVNKGGKITKLDTANGYYSNMTPNKGALSGSESSADETSGHRNQSTD
ncbi:hypothetical protein KJ966_24900 [bacterium]|nr:hypothetical protein [bacterium]